MAKEKLSTINPIECSLPKIYPVAFQKNANKKHDKAPIPSMM